eukprot:scaffold3951_cov58-Phaeocystis_antarctica.AAC.5
MSRSAGVRGLSSCAARLAACMTRLTRSLTGSGAATALCSLLKQRPMFHANDAFDLVRRLLETRLSLERAQTACYTPLGLAAAKQQQIIIIQL